ncbi:MAG: hypothetical protein JWO46_178 [Nocardioidaceae bacterium]|nr:hypothetical protein [Nocardioidaceae bacterium]
MTAPLPVAPAWFRVSHVDDAITRIEEPYADPWVSANAWHIRGRDRDVVIDTGLGVASLHAELGELFDREPIAVLTHGHLDHMGSAHEFSECWAHELEPTWTEGQGTLSGSRLLEVLGATDSDFDPPPEVMVTALPHAGYDPGAYSLMPVTPTRPLVDGDTIDLGDRALTVLHLPGHTPGSIALFDARNRVLFTGDVIYDPLAILDDLHGSDATAYAESMRRLLSLEVDVVHAGHGESFSDSRLRELVHEYLDSSRR